jgi:hypothetical protein
MSDTPDRLEQILDSLYLDAWGEGRKAEREQDGIRSVTPKYSEAKQAINQLQVKTLERLLEHAERFEKPWGDGSGKDVTTAIRLSAVQALIKELRGGSDGQ